MQTPPRAPVSFWQPYKCLLLHFAAAFDSYHMQDENGLWSGYGYEMMQGIAKYMQCTFSSCM